MRITDCHAHIYPEKIAQKASDSIGSFYSMKMAYNGSCEQLLEAGSRAGVSRYWVHSVATAPHQVRSINDFIAAQCAQHPEFIGFGTIHPDADIEAEVEHMIELGLCGVKIHPDFQKFFIDEERALPIYDCIAGRLPILVHMGDWRYQYSHPSRMARVLDMFPRLDCVGAHMGGLTLYEEALETLGKRRCRVDISSTFGFVKDTDYLKKLVGRWGAERILFGSDYPMWDASSELEKLLKLGLSDGDTEKILSLNAEDVIKNCSVNAAKANL